MAIIDRRQVLTAAQLAKRDKRTRPNWLFDGIERRTRGTVSHGRSVASSRATAASFVNSVVVPHGVFVDDGEGPRFAMHPVPTSADVLAILDRIAPRITPEMVR